MLRRTFLQGTGAALAGALSTMVLSAPNKTLVSPPRIIDWSSGMPPLYCLAYIDPEYGPHKGQEAMIAKYPITVIPQDDRSQFFRFRKHLSALNPGQKVLAYQMTLDEHGVPGPGHALMKTVTRSWLTLPGGIVPTIDIPSGDVLKRRLYDPRSAEFRYTFVQACKLLVNNHGFDGIFLDNCTIYPRFANIPFLGKELIRALQQLILEIRQELPKAILIGNSPFSWDGLNGEMNEDRPQDLPQEALPLATHVSPEINLYLYTMKDQNDLDAAKSNFELSIQNKCFYGAGINSQTIRWYPFFDQVLSEYQII